MDLILFEYLTVAIGLVFICFITLQIRNLKRELRGFRDMPQMMREFLQIFNNLQEERKQDLERRQLEEEQDKMLSDLVTTIQKLQKQSLDVSYELV
jgi:hypothetical protein